MALPYGLKKGAADSWTRNQRGTKLLSLLPPSSSQLSRAFFQIVSQFFLLSLFNFLSHFSLSLSNFENHYCSVLLIGSNFSRTKKSKSVRVFFQFVFVKGIDQLSLSLFLTHGQTFSPSLFVSCSIDRNAMQILYISFSNHSTTPLTLSPYDVPLIFSTYSLVS